MRISSTVARLAAFGLGLFVLAGCEVQGFSSAQQEWDRRRQEQAFALLDVTPERAVVSARGKLIAIDPAEGFCVSSQSIEVLRRSVIALLGDCAVERVAHGAKTGAQGRLQLPKPVPGIMTVSISGNSVLNDSNADDMDELIRFLKTPEGRVMLGRGTSHDTVSVVETRTSDGVLFVYVEDTDREVLPVLAPKFWRGFMDINDRLTVVTFSTFRDNPLKRDEMLTHLSDQVDALRRGNKVPPRAVETRVAAAQPVERKAKPFPEALRTATAVMADGGRLNDLKEVQELAVFIAPAPDGTPEIVPVPPPRKAVTTVRLAEALTRAQPPSDIAAPRPRAVSEAVSKTVSEAGSKAAPATAPVAPKRPR